MVDIDANIKYNGYCSGSKLQQVFFNILKNGAEAMIEKKYESYEPRFIIRYYHDNSKAVMEFEDNGPGIEEEECRFIFDPFFTTKKQGSGLGLAAVHRIVDLHGGWIKVESQLQQGTRFVVCMPRSGDDGVRLWHEGRTPWKRS